VDGRREKENVVLVEVRVSEIWPSNEVFYEVALARIGGAKDEQSETFLGIREKCMLQRMRCGLVMVKVYDTQI
jgi:hypothetical protein